VDTNTCGTQGSGGIGPIGDTSGTGMGQVVDIEDKKPRRSRAKRRKKPSKTALVLGGGGFTGGVYEIGALRALDLLAVNSTVNSFDVYVGTSAGSFVAAMLANGITPDEMMQVINTRVPSELEDLELGKMLSPNYMGFVKKALGLPFRSAEAARALLRLRDFSAIDLGVALLENLPTGLYNGGGIGDYVGEVLTEGGRSNDFRVIDPELYLTATDLDTTERIVFGEEGWRDVPISKAVECSTALPIVYKPVDLKGRQLVDGGIRSTTNVDIAVEAGAKFIVVVNPLVPYINDFEKTIPTMFGSRVRRVSDMGLPAIGNQTFRLIAHARLHQAVEQWQEKYPGVDIVLLEPEDTDELMFGTPIMDYGHRLDIARHGFESVTAALAKDYDRFSELASKHGLEISERRLRRVVEEAEAVEPEQTSAWRRVLEQTTSVLLRQSGEAS
jgi:NTE family protein